MSSLPTVTERQVNFTQTTGVISAAQKFVVPVPAFADGGEPLVYPQDHEQAGNPILDWQEKPIGQAGIVFWNAKDQAVQAAPGDGSAVIIINQVSETQAAKMYERYQALGNPDEISLASLKEFLAAAIEDGLDDQYNSNDGFIASKMTPVREGRWNIETRDGMFGHMKRDDRDISQAVYVAQPFQFQGPAATPQIFENGGVLVMQGEDIRGIQPDIFQETYRFAANGSEIADLGKQLANYDV